MSERDPRDDTKYGEHSLIMRFNAAEHEMLRRLADRWGCTMSDACRLLIANECAPHVDPTTLLALTKAVEELEAIELAQPTLHRELFDACFDLEARIIAVTRTCRGPFDADHPIAKLHHRVIAIHERHVEQGRVR